MVNYVRMRQTAERLIAKNGRDITLQKLVQTPSDPNQPWNGPDPLAIPETLQLKGVFVSPNTTRQFGLMALGEGASMEDFFQKCEQVIIVAQGDNDLTGYTNVLDRGVKWGVLAVQVLRPADLSILGFIGVRR